MADEDNEQEQDQEETKASKPKGGGGKVKLLLFIILGLLLVGGSIGGTLHLLGIFDTGDTEEIDEQADEVAPESEDEPKVIKRSPAMYFPIKPAFVVNYQSRGRQRFLQVDVALMTRSPEVYAAIQAHLPLIKNRLVMLLGGQVFEEIQTDEGRELLRQQSLEAVKAIMDAEIGNAEIDQVLFTNFVMQ
jgi:flagellar protein FliL